MNKQSAVRGIGGVFRTKAVLFILSPRWPDFYINCVPLSRSNECLGNFLSTSPV